MHLHSVGSAETDADSAACYKLNCADLAKQQTLQLLTQKDRLEPVVDNRTSTLDRKTSEILPTQLTLLART